MKRPFSWPIVPLLWLGTALRFLRLDAQSFWNDEGNSARLAERSVQLIVEGAAGDVHPPLYYLILALWRRLLGDSEFALRSLSAFAGILLIAGVYALARRWGPRLRPSAVRRAIPLFAALFAAIHPALVYYSQETRMYMLLALWAVLSSLVLIRLLPLLRRPASGPLLLWGGGYLLLTAAGLYTHYFYPAVLLSHNITLIIFLVGSHRRHATRHTPHSTDHTPHPYIRWSFLMLAAILLYLPWLHIFLRQTGGRAPDPFSAAQFLPNAARWLVIGETVPPNAPWLWLPITAALLLTLLGVLTPSPRISNPQTPVSSLQSPISPLSTLSTVLPPLLILLLGATRPAYYKFMIIVPPFLALLAARGLVNVSLAVRSLTAPARWLLRAALGLLLVLMLWGSARSLQHLYFDPAFARADYRGIAARIASEAHPDAGVILNAANQWEVFTYYHRSGAPVYPLPRGRPDAQRIEEELQQIAVRHDRLYALFWGEGERDPQRLVERWLDAHAFKAREEWVGDVRFVTYAVPPQPATKADVPADAVFGDHMTLTGYTLRPAEVAPGDIVQVSLFWQTTQALETRYKVFLHLIPEQGGPPLAQRDAEPVGNLAPTTTWQPRQTIVDNHGLIIPGDVAPGRYKLIVGLYPLEDPTARVPVTWRPAGQDEADTGDNYPLSFITVR